jgi:hypothetical protein
MEMAQFIALILCVRKNKKQLRSGRKESVYVYWETPSHPWQRFKRCAIKRTGLVGQKLQKGTPSVSAWTGETDRRRTG